MKFQVLAHACMQRCTVHCGRLCPTAASTSFAKEEEDYAVHAGGDSRDLHHAVHRKRTAQPLACKGAGTG